MTSEEILLLETSENTTSKLLDWEIEHIKDAMIEFAKHHVQKALRQASEKAEIVYTSESDNDYEIDKNSILNAYPLNQIR